MPSSPFLKKARVVAYAELVAECVYSNAAWSDCDPVTMLRRKTVAIKTEVDQSGCPKARVLTKDCTKEELTEGQREKVCRMDKRGNKPGFCEKKLCGESRRILSNV